jgi:multisubunit Na+/H+ antiporter MnhB subunit
MKIDQKEGVITFGIILLIIGVFGVFLAPNSFNGPGILGFTLVIVGAIAIAMSLMIASKKKESKVAYYPQQPQTYQPQQHISKLYCTNCGREIPIDARLCPYCGKAV